MRAKKIVHRGRWRRRLALAAWAALGASACDRQVDLGDICDGPASLLWHATFEPGDLSEWLSDGQGGTFTENTTAGPTATNAMAHAGQWSGRVSISPSANMTSTSYLFRNQPSPPAAYYSAWFYVPSTVDVSAWLSLTHFRDSPTGDGGNLTAIWDVNLYPLPAGGLAAQLYDYVTQVNLRQTTPVSAPLDSWFQLEILFSKSTDATGRIAIWQDGTLVLDNPDVATVQNDWVQWDAGGASDAMSPPSTIYLDDAAISLTRLGPGS